MRLCEGTNIRFVNSTQAPVIAAGPADAPRADVPEEAIADAGTADAEPEVAPLASAVEESGASVSLSEPVVEQ